MTSTPRSKLMFSFEFFPPKTEQGVEKLNQALVPLGKLHPSFFSVTFGAGGSTQEGTFDTIMTIKKAGYDAAPHLTCIGSTRENIRALLRRYLDHGIKRLVALRGDMPSGMREAGEFRYANELVSFVRAETGAQFHIEVAAYPECHPQARSAEADLANFARKIRAGASSAITQYFFNCDAYFRFVDDAHKLGIDTPIVPGIMPITNYAQLARFSDMCGAEIPRWIRKRLEGFGEDKEAIFNFGLEVVASMCDKLLSQGAPGLHFYTMNQAKATVAIWNNLNLSAR